MATVLTTNFSYTYPGKLSTEIFRKPTVGTPAISDMFTIRRMLKYKEQINRLDGLSKITRAVDGCDRTFVGTKEIDNTTLTLTEIEANVEWCRTDFEGAVGNILADQADSFAGTGARSFEPGRVLRNIITELVSDALRRDTFDALSFGDTGDADAFYSQIDGVWTQLIANAGEGSSYCVRQGSTDISTISASNVLTAMQEAYEDSPIILKQTPVPQKYFAVTGSVYEALMASYESNTTGSERMFLNLVEGQNGPSLMYRGIRVIPIYAWDKALAEATNPLNGTYSNLILYTTPSNHFVGVEREADMTLPTGWYSRDDRKFYMEAAYRMGYTYLHCDLQFINVG